MAFSFIAPIWKVAAFCIIERTWLESFFRKHRSKPCCSATFYYFFEILSWLYAPILHPSILRAITLVKLSFSRVELVDRWEGYEYIFNSVKTCCQESIVVVVIEIVIVVVVIVHFWLVIHIALYRFDTKKKGDWETNKIKHFYRNKMKWNRSRNKYIFSATRRLTRRWEGDSRVKWKFFFIKLAVEHGLRVSVKLNTRRYW